MPTTRRVAIAADHAAWEAKDKLAAHLREAGHDVHDCGCNGPESVDYPDFARAACARVQQGEADFAVLLCGSGVGMAIAANKMKGIRAALVSEPWTGGMCRRHNNANCICFGAKVTGFELIRASCDAFLEADFEEGRHGRRVGMVDAIEGSDGGCC